MERNRLTAISLFAVLVSGCSSTPRHFTPELAMPPADQVAYAQTLVACEAEGEAAGNVAKRKQATIASKGAGGAAISGAAVSGASWSAPVAAVSATIVAMPVLGLAWGIARANRAKKEKRLKETVTQCLSSEGYIVANWQRVKRPRNVEDAPAVPEVEANAPADGKSG